MDHIYVNDINKVDKCYVEVDSSTDHNFIIIEKKMKFFEQESKFFLTTDYNSINYDIINSNIINSDKYPYMIIDDNVNRITDNIINII